VLAIPAKRFEKATVSFLTLEEILAILAIPDRGTWIGRRDHTLLLTLFQTGLRVSELTGLRRADLHLGAGANLRCTGKGRKDRATPLTVQTVAVLRSWTTEHVGQPDSPLFPSRRGGPLSRDAVERLIAKYAQVAADHCPTLHDKTITAHVFRHSAAMSLLRAGVDTSVIAIWLGHESIRSTDPYLHADMAIKQQALDRIAPADAPTGRYRPPDRLLAYLQGL